MHPGTFAATTPDKPAVIMGGTGQVVTYAQLHARAERAAALLWTLGLRPGDHVAFQVENRPEFFELLWAAHRMGLWYTAVSTRLGPEETRYIVEDCSAKAFVVSDGVGATLAAPETFDGPARFVTGADAPGWERWEEAVAALGDAVPPEHVAGNDLLYSSGTTGRPKGVERSEPAPGLDEMDGVSGLCAVVFGFDADTVYLSPAPLYHAAPLRFTRAVHRLGGTVVQMEHFDAADYLHLVERYRVSATQVVPTMLIRLLKLDATLREAADVSSLRCLVHAAAPCPVPVKQQVIEWLGPVVWEYYAGTEGNGLMLCDSEQWLAHPGTVGRPLNVTVHIVGEAGEELPAGQAGLVYFEGPGDFAYRNDPEKTLQSHDERGWSTLGDIGYVDEDGYLYLTDRRANMIISGGVNIYPQEAENVLVLHPAVVDVAVFGVPNEEMGEEVKAVVQPAAGVTSGPGLEAELLTWCRDRLAHYKCPRSVDFEAELPRHPTGKLYKRVLKDRYWQAGRAI